MQVVVPGSVGMGTSYSSVPALNVMCVTSGSTVIVPLLPGSSIFSQSSSWSHSEPPGSSLLELEDALELDDSLLELEESLLLDDEQAGRFCGFAPWPL